MTIKRILSSCFLLTLLFSLNVSKAQVFNVTVTPNPLCAAAAGVTGSVGVNVPSAGAASYTFFINSPLTGGATLTVVSPSVSSVFYTGCGLFTITCNAYAANGTLQDQVIVHANVICPSGATVSASAGSVCPGAAVTLTANGPAVTWTWSPGGANGSTMTANPLANTCYTAIGTTAQGCTITADSCVIVQPISVSVTPASQTVCVGTELTLTATTNPATGVALQWFDAAGNPILGGTNATQTVSAFANSTFSVRGTISTCSAVAVASVTVGPNLSIVASPLSASICPTQTTAITAVSSATYYTWFVFPFPPNTNHSNTYPLTGPGIPVTYTVIGSIGTCTGIATGTIGVTAFSPTITPTSPSVCPGETFTLTGSGGANAINSYTWGYIPAAGPQAGVPNSICGLGTPGGCGPVQVETQSYPTHYIVGATSPQGCVDTVSILVGITPPVVVTLTSSSPSVCATSPVTITATGAANYSIYLPITGPPPNVFSANTSGVFVDNPTSATIYTVIGSNSSSLCPSLQTTIAVNMDSGGTLTVTASASAYIICPGSTVSLVASGGPNITWSPASALIPPATVGAGVPVVGTPSTTTTYTAVADNGGGCTGTALVTISVSSSPTITAAASPTAVCVGFTSTLQANGATSYTWTGSTFSTPLNQPSITAGPGSYTVVGGSAGANCASLPVTVDVGTAPPLIVTASQNHYTTCITNNSPRYSLPVVLTAQGASAYNWFPYDPLLMTYSANPQTTVRPPTSTCYTVTGTTSICSGTAVICVNVLPQFTMDVTPPQPVICYGDSTVLKIINISNQAVGPAFTYSWTESANAPPPSLSNPFSKTVTAFPQNTATYTVEIVDTRSCVSIPRIITVTVLPQPLTAVSIPTINSVPTNTVCFVGDIPSAPDNQITLYATNINPSLSLPGGVIPTFTWSSPYNSLSTDPFNSQVTVNAPYRTPFVVIYTVTSGYNGVPGCKREDTVSVRVIDCRPMNNANVVFGTDVVTDTICSRNCITYYALTDTLAGGPQTYSWKFTGGVPATSNLMNPIVCYDLPGAWNVILTVSNPYPIYENPAGSTGVKYVLNYMKVVDVPNTTIVPPGQLSSDTSVKFGQSIVLTGTNALHYSWSPDIDISSTTSSIVTVTPRKTTQYILTGYNSSGCFSSDTVNVMVIDDCGDIFVPNAFSPNGDGHNDELKVRGICLETMTFMVFSRWGEKVFETSDINIGWDGTYHGEQMNTGVFVYRLEGKTYSGKGYSSKGNVTLIR